MKQYTVKIEGVTPLIMHADNLSFGEKIQQWRKDPVNKELSTSGDDRSPSWTWVGYAYHDGRRIGMPSDNLMTMLREGGAKVKTGKMSETYKKHTQSGVFIDSQQWDLKVNGAMIDVKPIYETLIGENDFIKHIEYAEKNGFELFIKRAKIGQAKHVRVRPMFREWELNGTFTVMDEDQSGLTLPILRTIFDQCGSLIGLGDWRPSSPRASGTFGKFVAQVDKA